jgi:hypothetical protein
MDVKSLGKAWALAQREIATAARLHPPQLIKVPLSFPFLVQPAQTTLEGRNVRQKQRTTMEGGAAKAVDARRLSNEFQVLAQRDADLLHFLNRYGLWDDGQRVLPVEEIWEFQEWLRLVLRGSDKFRAQTLSPRGLFGRLPGPLARKFSLELEWNQGAPRLIVETNCCVAAITATMLIDIVRRTRYTRCEGCLVLFPSKPGKRFHSQACQHLTLVRRSRHPRNKGDKFRKRKR